MNTTLYTKSPKGGLQAVTVPQTLAEEVCGLHQNAKDNRSRVRVLERALREALMALEYDQSPPNYVLDARVVLRRALNR